MMINLKTALVAGILFTTAGSPSYGQAGGSAVPFLMISPDARASAMGDVGTAIADNLYAVFWNPAGLGFQSSQQVALSYSKWLPQFNADLFYSYGSYGQYFDEVDGTLAATFTFMNLGEFTRTGVDGTPLGKFRSNEFAITTSYGTLINPDLAAGISFRYIQSNLAPAGGIGQAGAGVGVSGAFDLGFLWRPAKLSILGLDVDNALSLGLNLQNVGPKMTYDRESDPLPTVLRTGFAFKLVEDEFSDLLISADFSKLLVRRDQLGSDPIPTSFVTAWGRGGIETGVGLEYVYDQVVAMRGGYFSEPMVAGNRKFFTMGAGVKYDLFVLDFSYILTIEENHPLANTLRFSMLVDWGQLR